MGVEAKATNIPYFGTSSRGLKLCGQGYPPKSALGSLFTNLV